MKISKRTMTRIKIDFQFLHEIQISTKKLILTINTYFKVRPYPMLGSRFNKKNLIFKWHPMKFSEIMTWHK